MMIADETEIEKEKKMKMMTRDVDAAEAEREGDAAGPEAGAVAEMIEKREMSTTAIVMLRVLPMIEMAMSRTTRQFHPRGLKNV